MPEFGRHASLPDGMRADLRHAVHMSMSLTHSLGPLQSAVLAWPACEFTNLATPLQGWALFRCRQAPAFRTEGPALQRQRAIEDFDYHGHCLSAACCLTIVAPIAKF